MYENSKDNFCANWLLGDEPFPPGSEPGELGELRGRLLFLLETSKHYQAQHLLTHFPECKSCCFFPHVLFCYWVFAYNRQVSFPVPTHRGQTSVLASVVPAKICPQRSNYKRTGWMQFPPKLLQWPSVWRVCSSRQNCRFRMQIVRVSICEILCLRTKKL